MSDKNNDLVRGYWSFPIITRSNLLFYFYFFLLVLISSIHLKMLGPKVKWSFHLCASCPNLIFWLVPDGWPPTIHLLAFRQIGNCRSLSLANLVEHIYRWNHRNNPTHCIPLTIEVNYNNTEKIVIFVFYFIFCIRSVVGRTATSVIDGRPDRPG